MGNHFEKYRTVWSEVFVFVIIDPLHCYKTYWKLENFEKMSKIKNYIDLVFFFFSSSYLCPTEFLGQIYWTSDTFLPNISSIPCHCQPQLANWRFSYFAFYDVSWVFFWRCLHRRFSWWQVRCCIYRRHPYHLEFYSRLLDSLWNWFDSRFQGSTNQKPHQPRLGYCTCHSSRELPVSIPTNLCLAYWTQASWRATCSSNQNHNPRPNLMWIVLLCRNLRRSALIPFRWEVRLDNKRDNVSPVISSILSLKINVSRF